MKSNSRVTGIFLVIFSTMLWGVSGTVAQFLFQEKGFTAGWLVSVRLLISGLVLIIYGYIKKDNNLTKIWCLKKDRIKLILFGILGMLGVQYTYFAAINHSNAATAAILQYLSPVIITCYLVARNKKLPNFKELVAIILALTGTFFIITSGDIHNLSLSKLGLFWGLSSAVCSAIYTLQPVSLIKQYGSIVVVGWGMLIGGISFSFIHSPFNFVGEISISSMLSVLFVIVFGTIIAFYCYLESLKHLVPTETSILGCVEPLSATFLSILWLKVPFGFAEFLGTLCIILTVIILSFSSES
ncbi:DMT family transporter [uncultured Clostridium sp.]|uniref:DMT family transporter n=1 Tax=uncultured Clostridium sp. TaxID=59620 RepID=UPI0025E04338|nr:DMT family transporter [uncultured Clostridium sp.]